MQAYASSNTFFGSFSLYSQDPVRGWRCPKFILSNTCSIVNTEHDCSLHLKLCLSTFVLLYKQADAIQWYHVLHRQKCFLPASMMNWIICYLSNIPESVLTYKCLLHWKFFFACETRISVFYFLDLAERRLIRGQKEKRNSDIFSKKLVLRHDLECNNTEIEGFLNR